MYEYPLSQLRSKEIMIENVIFIYAMTKKGSKTAYDRKEELKEAGFIFNSQIRQWGGWITNLEDGKKIIDTLLNMDFFAVGFDALVRGSELLEKLEDYEEEIN